MRQSKGPEENCDRKVPLREKLRDSGGIFVKAVTAWVDHSASSMGAALAFYTLFSVAPIFIIALSLAGYFFGPHTAETELLAQLRDLTGNAGADALRSVLISAQYSNKTGLAAVFGLVTLVIGATSVFGELQHSLDVIWSSARKPGSGWWTMVRRRLLSFGMVLGVGFLLLVSLIASAVLAAFADWMQARVPGLAVTLPILDVILSFAMTVLLFAMIYKYVPRETITWRDVWVGAAVTAFLFTVGKSLIGFYLGRSSFSSAYGAAGSLVVLLMWVYYSAQMFLLGAEFTRAFAYSRGSHVSPLGALNAAAD